MITVLGIEFSDTEIMLMTRVAALPNGCSELLNPEKQAKNPKLIGLYRKGAMRSTMVQMIMGPSEPGIAITDFGRAVLAVLREKDKP